MTNEQLTDFWRHKASTAEQRIAELIVDKSRLETAVRELQGKAERWAGFARERCTERDRLRAKLATAREALETVLRENAHLADGEVCTLAPVKRALAAITQPPAATKCDGNHAGPPCLDPECWLNDPPAAEEPKP
jgi:hypothetical protein